MKINTPKRVKSFENPSVWLEFSPLARATDSVNLGQGFPDWEPPTFLQEAAITSVQGSDYSCYARSAGHLNLVKSISDNYSSKLNRTINPTEEILVTVGASEALFIAIMSFIEKGDEVITIEPAFDVYYGALAMAEAVIKPVSLISSKDIPTCSSHFVLDWDYLEKTINKNTKAIILNSPHNPSGKVFNIEELQRLATILEKYPDCLIISDEVYENIIFGEEKHIPFATIKNMYDRTISIYSAGKTFSVTGWKVGWAIGPKDLIKRMQLSQQWVVFSVSTPHQEAIAQGLYKAKETYKGFNNYYDYLSNLYFDKRTILYEGLKKAGLNPILPQGSFFILCDISDIEGDYLEVLEKIKEMDSQGKIAIDHSTYSSKDYNYCRELSLKKQVTAIPTSAFYLDSTSSSTQKWVRFAFCKSDETLKLGVDSLL